MDDPFPDAMMPCIERFFRDTHPRLHRGQDIYPDVFETDLFFPLQRQSELAKMIQLARLINPRVVMEIGADKGGGLYHWCMGLSSVDHVIACEIRGLPYANTFDRMFPDTEFLWLPGDSKDPAIVSTVHGWLSAHRAKIDVLFIDGDKSSFVKDFDTYRSSMEPGGLVFMHDVKDYAPREAFLDIAGRGGYNAEQIINTSDADLAVHRGKRGKPVANAHEGWLRYWHGRSCGVGVLHIPK